MLEAPKGKIQDKIDAPCRQSRRAEWNKREMPIKMSNKSTTKFADAYEAVEAQYKRWCKHNDLEDCSAARRGFDAWVKAGCPDLSPPAPEFTIRPANGRAEVGMSKGMLQFPFFLMGCPGDEDAIKLVALMPVRIKALDKPFWDAVARKIKDYPFFDWDWVSLRDNVIRPNEAHIRKVCEIPNDKVWKRFVEDGMVFLNNWFDPDTVDNEEDEDGEPYVMPNRNSVFKDIQCEY